MVVDPDPILLSFFLAIPLGGPCIIQYNICRSAMIKSSFHGQHSKIEFPLGIRYGLDDVQLIQYIVLFGSDSNRAFTVNVQQLLNSPWAYGNTGMFSN